MQSKHKRAVLDIVASRQDSSSNTTGSGDNNAHLEFMIVVTVGLCCVSNGR